MRMSEPVNALNTRTPSRFRRNSNADRERAGPNVSLRTERLRERNDGGATNDGEMYRLALELSREETKRERYRAVVALVNGAKTSGEAVDVAKIVAWLNA